jgi:hypothetical protein
MVVAVFVGTPVRVSLSFLASMSCEVNYLCIGFVGKQGVAIFVDQGSMSPCALNTASEVPTEAQYL